MYDINKVQLKMLQITSRHAEQHVTIRCHNLAFDDRDVMFHTMKAGSSISPQVFSSGCSVSCIECITSLYLHTTVECPGGIFSWCQ